jgi:hypothetical protein
MWLRIGAATSGPRYQNPGWGLATSASSDPAENARGPGPADGGFEAEAPPREHPVVVEGLFPPSFSCAAWIILLLFSITAICLSIGGSLQKGNGFFVFFLLSVIYVYTVFVLYLLKNVFSDFCFPPVAKQSQAWPGNGNGRAVDVPVVQPQAHQTPTINAGNHYVLIPANTLWARLLPWFINLPTKITGATVPSNQENPSCSGIRICSTVTVSEPNHEHETTQNPIMQDPFACGGA